MLTTVNGPHLMSPTCKHGHAWSENETFNCRGHRVCTTCTRISRRKHNQTSEESRTDKLRYTKGRNRRMRAAGTLRCGYTATVINSVGRERLMEAFEIVRQTGKIGDAASAIGSVWKLHAIKFFHPKVAAQFRKIAKEARQRIKAEAVKPIKPSVLRIASVDVLDRINAVIPRGLSRDQRQDVASALTEAVLAGHVPLKAIAQQVNSFVRANFRADHNKFGPLSLDMPAHREGDTPLVDTISEGLWQ